MITGRDQQKLTETDQLCLACRPSQSDVSKADDIQALLRRVQAEFPACDTLINNAGHRAESEI